jgi:hypothetical protein
MQKNFEKKVGGMKMFSFSSSEKIKKRVFTLFVRKKKNFIYVREKKKTNGFLFTNNRFHANI